MLFLKSSAVIASTILKKVAGANQRRKIRERKERKKKRKKNSIENRLGAT
jgi:hypothetical protein